MEHKKRVMWIVGILLMICYLFTLIYLLFFASGFRYSNGEMKYNLIPFHEISRYMHWSSNISVINLLGNIAAFIPLGFLLPVVSRRRIPVPGMIGILFVSPIVVEIIQLVTRVGICDVDDVILNFAGGLIGLGIYLGLAAIVHTIGKKKHHIAE